MLNKEGNPLGSIGKQKRHRFQSTERFYVAVRNEGSGFVQRFGFDTITRARSLANTLRESWYNEPDFPIEISISRHVKAVENEHVETIE
jgi:hypothetical protein